MKKTSKKTVKRADKKSVSYRLTNDQLYQVEMDLELENESRGAFPASLAAYAKQALLEHRRLASVEARLRALYKQEKHVADNHAQDIVESVDGAQDNQAFRDYARTLAAVNAILDPESL